MLHCKGISVHPWLQIRRLPIQTVQYVTAREKWITK